MTIQLYYTAFTVYRMKAMSLKQKKKTKKKHVISRTLISGTIKERTLNYRISSAPQLNEA